MEITLLEEKDQIQENLENYEKIFNYNIINIVM